MSRGSRDGDRPGSGAGAVRRRRRRTRGSRTSSTERRRGRTRRSTSGRSRPEPPRSRGRRPRAGRARRRSTPSRARSSSAPRRSAPTGTRSRRSATPSSGFSTRSRTPPTVDPQRRRHDPHARGPLHGRQHGRRPGPEADRLQLRPLPGRAADLRPRHARRPRRPTSWAGASGPFPPASNASDPPFTYSGAYCARNGTTNLTNLAGTGPLTHNTNADNHQHWTQVACGHEVQINETLTGTGPLGGSDPIKTGSIYNFRNLNAQQSRTYERLEKGVWHEMEIRTIGQQYTVLVDGRMINQFDNSIPKIASRNGDPATVARQFAQRLPRPADPRRQRPHLLPRDPGQGDRAGRHPGQHRRADGDGHRLRRAEPDLQPGHLDPGHGRHVLAQVVPVEQDRARRTRTSAPRARSTSAASPRRPMPAGCTATRS